MKHFFTQFKAMGTTVRIWLATEEQRKARVLESVPLWFAEWEATFSRFLPGSELNYVNQHTGNWVQVSSDMLGVVNAAMDAARITNGLFNPLVLPAVEAAGYDHSFSAEDFIPGTGSGHTAVADWRALEADDPYSCVFVPAGARLDLGGIVKGWAAQRAASYLAAVGPCLVDAGGDIAAYGSPDETGGWWVTLPDSATVSSGTENDRRPRLLLVDSMVATSGTTYRRWQRGNQTLHHLIDPRTGEPSTSDILMATVVAPEATIAEAWAKASLIGAEMGMLPTRIVDRSGGIHCNEAFERLIA